LQSEFSPISSNTRTDLDVNSIFYSSLAQKKLAHSLIWLRLVTTAIVSFPLFLGGYSVNGVAFIYHLSRAYKEKIMIAAAGTIGCLCFIPGSHSYGFQEFHIKEMAFTGTVGIVLIPQSDVGPLAYMAAYLATVTICLSVMICLEEMTQLCPSRGRLFDYHQTFFDVDLRYTVGWIYW
jgi:hypothetical protein